MRLGNSLRISSSPLVPFLPRLPFNIVLNFDFNSSTLPSSSNGRRGENSGKCSQTSALEHVPKVDSKIDLQSAVLFDKSVLALIKFESSLTGTNFSAINSS